MDNSSVSNKALKAGVWYTFSNFISKGLIFLSTPIFTRVLSKTEYGQYSNFATWQTLLLVLVTWELYSTIARARYDYEEEMDQYVSSITLAGSLITMVFYILAILFMSFVSEFLSIEPKYVHIMFIYLLTAPALQILQAKYRIFMEYKFATLLTLVSSVGSICVAVVMVYLCNDKLFGRIFGQQAVLIIVNTAIFVWIVFKGRALKVAHCKYAFAIALPLVPHLLAGNLLGSFDKIAIQKLCGPEDLAYYSVAFNCALLAKVLWDSLNQAMVPWLYDKLSLGKTDEIKKVNKYYIAIFMFIAVGIMLFVPEVVFIFGGKEYTLAKYVMPPIIMGSCFQFVYATYVNLEMYEKKTLSISIGTIAAGLLNIPLNFFFIEKYGYVAAAYTTMFCYGALMSFHYFIVKRYKMDKVYSNRFNFVILAAMCVVTIVMEYIYRFDLMRWICILAYIVITGAMVFINRQKLIPLVNSILRKSK